MYKFIIFVFSVRMTEKIHKGIKKKLQTVLLILLKIWYQSFTTSEIHFFRIAVHSAKLLRKLELARPV